VPPDFGHVDGFAGQHVHAVFQPLIQMGRIVLEGTEFVLFDALDDVGAQHIKLQPELRNQQQAAEGHGAESHLGPDAEVFHGSVTEEAGTPLFLPPASTIRRPNALFCTK